jgi:hypothetical protein
MRALLLVVGLLVVWEPEMDAVERVVRSCAMLARVEVR